MQDLPILDLSFSQDSPLFSKRINEYESETSKLLDYFKLICKSMRTFCHDMNRATKSCQRLQHDLSGHGGLTLAGSKAHAKVQNMLVTMSEVFGEIANSQEILADSLQQSFVPRFEEFISSDVAREAQTQTVYRKEKILADEATIRYLQSDHQGYGFGRAMGRDRDFPPAYHTDLKAYDLTQTRKRLELSRYDLVASITEMEVRKNFEVAEICVASLIALRTHYHYCSEKLHSCDKYVSSLNKQQQEERVACEAMKAQSSTRREALQQTLQSAVERAASQLPPALVEERDQLSQVTTDRLDTVVALSGTVLHPDDVERVTSVASTALLKFTSLFGGFRPSVSTTAQSSSATTTPMEATENVSSARKSLTADNVNSGQQLQSFAQTPVAIDPSQQVPPNAFKTTIAQGLTPPLIEVETRVRAFDRTDLEPFYVHNSMDQYAGVIKQGYVWERGPGKLLASVWTRQWLVLDATKLYVICSPDRTDNSTEVNVLCDLVLASVRDCARGTDCGPYTFEVQHANVRTYVFQAEGPKEHQAWVEIIRGCVERRLALGCSASPYLQVSGNSGLVALSGNGSAIHGAAINGNSNSTWGAESIEATARREEQARRVQSLLSANPSCAECGRSDPGPDWVSLNLGALLCIDCSGAHRALGVHISKVRSLALDDIDLAEHAFLACMGNVKSNMIWYANESTTGSTKTETDSGIPPPPTSQDGQTVRERFVRAKYEQKLFMASRANSSISTPVLDLQVQLLDACSRGDAFGVVNCVAHGADLNMTYIDAHSGSTCSSRTPIMEAVRAGSVSCAVALLLNGAEIGDIRILLEAIGTGSKPNPGLIEETDEDTSRSSQTEVELLTSYLRARADAKRSTTPTPFPGSTQTSPAATESTSAFEWELPSGADGTITIVQSTGTLPVDSEEMNRTPLNHHSSNNQQAVSISVEIDFD